MLFWRYPEALPGPPKILIDILQMAQMDGSDWTQVHFLAVFPTHQSTQKLTQSTVFKSFN
jgi:hypothetical protein